MAELPLTVIAKMSNGTTKLVSVVWDPRTIDTSVAGTRTAVGTVEGFSGKVTYTLIIEAIETGETQISLFKDSNSSKINFDNLTEFYLVNKDTGKIYKNGQIPSQSTRKNQYLMGDLPEGEYTIHTNLPEGMDIKEIQLGESYKETIYHEKSAPLVIEKDKVTYVKVILKAESTLDEIKSLEDIIVSKTISRADFIAALPMNTTIVDSSGKEHQVDLKWDIRPFVFDSWKKPGEYTLTSEFFTLPLSVSNTDPATRLEVKLSVIFSE